MVNKPIVSRGAVRPRPRFLLFGALLFTALLSACASKEVKETETSITPIVPVRAAAVTLGNVTDRLVVTGHTEAVSKEKLVAPIAGQLLTFTAFEGMYVRAGEVLATIQSKEAQASEEGARIMLAQAKTPEDRARAERMVALAKEDQNGVQVKSKISGLVASRSTNAGEFVQESQELLSIIAIGDIAFVADVPLFQMSQVRIGAVARVTLPTLPNTNLSATVLAIKPMADSSSQTGKVVFRFTNLPESVVHVLRTGIAGTAEITLDVHTRAMLVPKSAILRNDETNERTVMTFGADSIAHPVVVIVGTGGDSLISVVSDALKPGMPVITEGNYALADSTHITLSQPSAPSPNTDKK